MNRLPVSRSHVLVIGSGGAGIRAALEAVKYGSVCIVSKTITGKGGCTVMAEGGINAAVNPADSCKAHFEDTVKGGAYLNDRALAEALTADAPARINELMEWGACFELTENDALAQRPFGGQKFARTCYAGDHTGHEIVMTLLEKLRGSDVEIRDETTVLSLITSGGAVCGAVVIDSAGNLSAITADAVVLATGGAGQLYPVTTNSTAGTGDGYALAYRAGAKLIDMEEVQFHPTGAVKPADSRGRLITEAVRGEGGILLNAAGERFMENYDAERMELSTRDVVSRSISTEISEGRGTPSGGVFLDVSHLPSDVIESRLPLMLSQFLKSGIDIRKEAMEVAPTAHHFMGGVAISPEGKSSVAGLFAAGEVSGGVHGGNRLGGNALAETQVFGKRAGESAGKYTGLCAADAASAAEEALLRTEKEIESLYSGTVSPASVKKELQNLMWKNVGIYRNELDLRVAEREIKQLSSAKLKIASVTEAAAAFTVKNMLTVAALVVNGALLRRESRGAHTRTDIPVKWTPEKSPFGHTWFVGNKSGIEIREEFLHD
ncbi:MAG: fumarate reductase (CoM/CoB) subunit TfrA [Methanocorpusculum sp.]|nr:fumarate reductase (CoM/CoB) subunit TfrA [Methanocorpusculum sp.]